MSLLLQALQKAAKSREENQGELSGDALSADEELALEPISPEPVLRDDTPTASPTPSQAATLLEASRAPGFDPIEYAREHQMLVFLAVAVLFAIGYGAYVYVQVANPFRSEPAPPPIVSAPPTVVASTQPVAEATDKISGLPGASTGAGGDASVQSPAPAAAISIFDAPAAPVAVAPAADQPPPQRIVAVRDPAPPRSSSRRRAPERSEYGQDRKRRRRGNHRHPVQSAAGHCCKPPADHNAAD